MIRVCVSVVSSWGFLFCQITFYLITTKKIYSYSLGGAEVDNDVPYHNAAMSIDKIAVSVIKIQNFKRATADI